MSQFFNIEYVLKFLPQLLSRAHVTLFIVILALIFGLIMGLFLAVCRFYNVPVLRQLSTVYISFMRGTPMIVQLFIAYFGIPSMLGNIGININHVDSMVFVVVTYALNEAAFLSEIVRGAIKGVDYGQFEAAYSVGMTSVQTFTRIIGPQAFRILLPNLGISVVSLLKETSLAFTIGVIDITGKANAISSQTYSSLEAYTAASIIFVSLSILLEILFSLLSQKAEAGHRVPKVQGGNPSAI